MKYGRICTAPRFVSTSLRSAIAAVLPLAILLVACSPSPPIPTTDSTSEGTDLLTRTSEPPTHPSPSLTATAERKSPIRHTLDVCLPVATSFPRDLVSQGTLFLGDFSELGAIGPISVLEQGGGLRVLDLPAVNEAVVTPRASRMAYRHLLDQGGGVIVVIDGDGAVLGELGLEDSRSWFEWIDEERLAITLEREQNLRTDIANPFSGDTVSISPELPQFWRPTEPWYGYWSVSYEPSLSLVAYPIGDELPGGIALFDMVSRKTVWRLERLLPDPLRPSWSPDGQQLAVAAQDRLDHFEVYVVNRDGSYGLWVDVAFDQEVRIGRVSWSPNGRHLAFAPVGGQPLLLLDTQRGELLNYCLPADAQLEGVVWSPDSSQLIIPRYGFPAVLLDLTREMAGEIISDTDFRPLAWLASTP